MTLFVGNISFKATEQDIESIFAQYGTVKQVKLPLDRDTGRKRGFAFVDLETDADEQKAIEELDGAAWMGRNIQVNKAQPRRSDGGMGRGGRNG